MQIKIQRKKPGPEPGAKKRQGGSARAKCVKETAQDREAFDRLYQMTLDTDAARFDALMRPVK